MPLPSGTTPLPPRIHNRLLHQLKAPITTGRCNRLSVFHHLQPLCSNLHISVPLQASVKEASLPAGMRAPPISIHRTSPVWLIKSIALKAIWTRIIATLLWIILLRIIRKRLLNKEEKKRIKESPRQRLKSTDLKRRFLKIHRDRRIIRHLALKSVWMIWLNLKVLWPGKVHHKRPQNANGPGCPSLRVMNPWASPL